MADVFLSYKRAERDKVRALTEALTRVGFDVWNDTHLRPGDQFAATINEELRTAGAIVVCWSREAVESDWVQGEAHKAHARGVYISLKLEECDPPVPFNAFQDADFTTWATGTFAHDGLAEVVAALAEKLKRQDLLLRYRSLASQELAAEHSEDVEVDADEAQAHAEAATESVAAPSSSYLLRWINTRTDIGAKSLSSSLAQISFEEEILRDPCTRWIVSEKAPESVEAHAKHVSSLMEAIDRSADGDCIALLPGTYRGSFEIEKNIRLIGFGDREKRPLLVGDDVGAVLDIKADARIENLHIESRDKSFAIRVHPARAPTIIRCLVERKQIADSPNACVQIQGRANPTFLACTISSIYVPGIRFVAAARGVFVATDVGASFADAVVLGAARPRFDRSTIVSYGGHAIVTTQGASATFEGCTLHASDKETIVVFEKSYSKFVGNRISGRRGSLLKLLDGAGGAFERNRLEPDPDNARIEAEKAQERRKLFPRRAVLDRAVFPAISAAGQSRSRFSQNRLPDGSIAEPPASTSRRRRG